MTNLNENEARALNAIVETCDDLDGDLFTRFSDVALAVLDEFGWDGHTAGGYITQLIKKGYLELEEDDGYDRGVWVNA